MIIFCRTSCEVGKVLRSAKYCEICECINNNSPVDETGDQDHQIHIKPIRDVLYDWDYQLPDFGSISFFHCHEIQNKMVDYNKPTQLMNHKIFV